MRSHYPDAEKRDLKWNIYKAGLVADLTVSEWGARSKLKAEELGLAEKDIPELIRLGHKNLMKKEHLAKLRSVGGRAEYFLLANSFAFPFGNARFVPFNLVEKVIEFMNECREEHGKNLEEFLQDYDIQRAEMIEEYRIIFADIFRKMGNGDSLKMGRVMERLGKKYPTKEELRKKFNFDFVIFEISAPDFRGVSDREALDQTQHYMEISSLYKQKANERIDAFLEDVVSHLKAMILKTTSNMKKRLDGDDLSKNTIKAFIRFADSFKDMDFVGTDLDEILKAFGNKIKDLEKSELSDEGMKSRLQSEIAEIEEKATSLDIDTSVGRFLRRIDLGSEE